jgi:hypothetical protein
MVMILLVVSLVAGLAMMWTLTQSKRQSDLGRRDADRQQFQTTMARMKHVLDAAQLCTCNLKGLLIANAAGPVNGWRIDLTPDNGERELFGFYRLDSTNTANMLCASGPQLGNTDLDPARDVVFHLDSDGTYPGALRGARFSLNGFSFVADTGDPQVKRYRARATLAAVDGRGQGRSNIADPIDTDVFIEVANSRIRQCYQPVSPPLGGSTSTTGGGSNTCPDGTKGKWVKATSIVPLGCHAPACGLLTPFANVKGGGECVGSIPGGACSGWPPIQPGQNCQGKSLQMTCTCP